MFEFYSNNIVLVIAGIITTVIGGIYSLIKINRELKKIKSLESLQIIEEAEKLDHILKEKMETRINLLEIQLQNLEASINKDLENIKDNHAIELKNLSERIELLRDDLHNQHSQILSLLTKLVN
jgi:hypothetical protein